MKFLVDNQLPPALADFLRARGEEAQHVLELGFDRASDQELWFFAQQHGWIVISKDGDFLHLAKRATGSARLLWIRFGNCRILALLTAFEKLWPDIQAALEAGEEVIEIR